MERTVKIIQVLPEQKFNGKNGEIVKNSFVVEWQDNGYTQKLCLEVIGEDKFEKMKKAVVVGNEVIVKYEATSREWNGKFYTTATCFYCANVGGQQQAQSPSPAPQNSASAPQQTNSDDQLPF